MLSIIYIFLSPNNVNMKTIMKKTRKHDLRIEINFSSSLDITWINLCLHQEN